MSTRPSRRNANDTAREKAVAMVENKKPKRINFDVPADEHKRLLRYCLENETTVADLMRQKMREVIGDGP